MMRHVYALGATDIRTSPQVRIVVVGTQLRPERTQNFNSTYLHMFGLDDRNEARGVAEPDDEFDFSNPEPAGPGPGIAVHARRSPLQPSRADRHGAAHRGRRSCRFRASELGAALPGGRTGQSTLYTLSAADRALPSNRFRIEATITGTGSAIILPQDIIEGSEVVKIGERTLQRGLDYDIESFFGGRITLKGDALALLVPGATISVTYQYLPAFGGGKSTLLGVSGSYETGIARPLRLGAALRIHR